MFTTVSVQLPTTTLLALIEQLQRRGGTQDLSEGMASAVEFWLADQRRLPPGAEPRGLHGYQWKALFLPEGTVLRSWSYGEHNYARVEGDQIMHDGRAVSPNQFARSFARTTRNAWTDLYVRRPGDPAFKLACVLREEIQREQEALREARQRRMARGQQETQVTPVPAAVAAPPPAEVKRDPTPGEGWDLPERRKHRFRIEDVAVD